MPTMSDFFKSIGRELQIVVLEAAKEGLTTAYVREEMDISDEYAEQVLDVLKAFLEGE